MADAPDIELFRLAATEDRVVLSEDTDFGTLLALTTEVLLPSVVLFRRMPSRRSGPLFEALSAHLPLVETDLRAGAIVVITQERLRIRRLPLR